MGSPLRHQAGPETSSGISGAGKPLPLEQRNVRVLWAVYVITRQLFRAIRRAKADPAARHVGARKRRKVEGGGGNEQILASLMADIDALMPIPELPPTCMFFPDGIPLSDRIDDLYEQRLVDNTVLSFLEFSNNCAVAVGKEKAPLTQIWYKIISAATATA